MTYKLMFNNTNIKLPVTIDNPESITLPNDYYIEYYTDEYHIMSNNDDDPVASYQMT